MKIAQINMIHNGSTGNIMRQLSEQIELRGWSSRTYSPIPFSRRERIALPNIENHFYWGSRFENAFHHDIGTALGINGLLSRRGTQQLIEELENFKPEIIHLHNLHSFCINLPMLFDYISKIETAKVIWTLHDCWSFTGHCPHFITVGCDKWRCGCFSCPQPKVYPKMYLDTSKYMYGLKKKLFSTIENMTLVTPSNWLKELTKESFLKAYDCVVINNGIDLEVFKPLESDFRHRYGISDDKKILLGVASDWGYRKGLDVFIELSRCLDSNWYQIVLVGTNPIVDQSLPENIISINRTNNTTELAEIYAAADLFVNPTREDTYPTVNMEALACGTPVITFDTGGSPEILDSTCGKVVPCNNIELLKTEIINITCNNVFSREACLKRSRQFDKTKRFEEYIRLYENCTYSA